MHRRSAGAEIIEEPADQSKWRPRSGGTWLVRRVASYHDDMTDPAVGSMAIGG